MTRIDDAMKCILDAETEYRGHPYDIRDDDLRRWLSSLDAGGHLMPNLPSPTAYLEGLPYWGRDYQRVGVVRHPCGHGLYAYTPHLQWARPEELRAEAARLLAAADYIDRNQK